MTTHHLSLNISLLQSNMTVGAIEQNCERIIAAIRQAEAAHAHVLITPELALTGYPPEDLLWQGDFAAQCEAALSQICNASIKVAVLLGHPHWVEGRCYNAASLLFGGEVVAMAYKQILPNTEVFDEKRYFTAGETAAVVEVQGVRMGIAICEDAWQTAPIEKLKAGGAQLLVSLNASPFDADKAPTRLRQMRQRVSESGLALLYCNLLGGQDELVFDGASFALNADGTTAYQAPAFEAVQAELTWQNGVWHTPTSSAVAYQHSTEASIYAALVLGVRDYIGKNGFPGAIIGLSGGIDSALTLCIAVDALGAEHVRAVMMASPYTAQMSLDDARTLADNLGVRYDELPIATAMTVFDDLLAPQFKGMAADTTEENIQSRIRGLLLMALSNKTGALVLTTGNKSEMAMGYATLYGDMAGGFAVLKDVYKTMVFRLTRWRNQQGSVAVVPDNIIRRPPSAELRPDQLDQDSLPPYDVLDQILKAYMEDNVSVSALVAQGFSVDMVHQVVRLLRLNEYKRRQAPVGPRVSARAFGKDWRMPITSAYRDKV